MIGPVVNDLEYTIALEQQAKEYGFKFLLNFHYSDTWADPGKQHLPKAWEALGLKELTDSVYRYTHNVMMKMKGADVYPDMVQIGNEINNGMLWPHGYLWPNNEPVRWYELAQLLKAGIKAVKDTDADNSTDIMIHAATGGDIIESDNFYANLQLHGVEFDIIGLSYYPWWHGTFDELEKNLNFLSGKYQQQISVVETAYYANGWYPEPDEFTLDIQPYPPTEPGQYSYMRELAVRLKKFPKVTSLFYWEPEAIEVPDSQLYYLGRSLFSRDGNAFMGISAWKNE